jgi:hypothetical protein
MLDARFDVRTCDEIRFVWMSMPRSRNVDVIDPAIRRASPTSPPHGPRGKIARNGMRHESDGLPVSIQISDQQVHFIAREGIERAEGPSIRAPRD